MGEATSIRPGIAWRGVWLVASTYVYFLIFAQFGFLKRLAELGIGVDSLTPVMGAMAAGGVLASLFGQRALHRWRPAVRLRAGLLGCALAAALTLMPLSAPLAGLAGALIGLSLGVLTVTLVAHLRIWVSGAKPLLSVAIGTGLGYFLCNVPWLFTATPRAMAAVSGLGCLAAVGLVAPGEDQRAPDPELHPAQESPGSRNLFPLTLLAFTALIWLDSAAFFIIQNSPDLKSGTWAGTLHLWRNGCLHLLAALASAWLIRRRGLLPTLLAAFVAIGSAGLLLHDPARAPLAAILYPIGVSLYSVALVAYPSLLLKVPYDTRNDAGRERMAGLLYAVAGWIGSAMGIGMGQHLHRVPTAFIVVAGTAIAAPLLWRLIANNPGPSITMAGVVVLSFSLEHWLLPRTNPDNGGQAMIDQGRQVYIAEGCIHCHSQYVRPHDAADLTMWGPSRDVEEIRREHPPLIGNRRQGPDLSQVGSRRSPLWLHIHFMDPRTVSYRIMPSYAYLFAPGESRGDALVAYVSSLRTPDAAAHLQLVRATWQPLSYGPAARAVPAGEQVFQEHCATCHVASGKARAKWRGSFHPLPPDLFHDRLDLLPCTGAHANQVLSLERIVKFGIPGTNMPGHEYLPDAEITQLSEWLLQTRETQVDQASNSAPYATSKARPVQKVPGSRPTN